MTGFFNWFRMFVLSLALSACANQYFEFKPLIGLMPDQPHVQNFWLWGLYQTNTLNAAEICKGTKNIISVRMHSTVGQAAIGILTLGIYSPRSVTVRCSV